MLIGTGISIGDEALVPVKATATGRIEMWYHTPGETLGDMRIGLNEGDRLCTIDARYNGFPRLAYVFAPITGYLVEIIKGNGEGVTEGETIGRMRPEDQRVPPEEEPPIYPFPPEEDVPVHHFPGWNFPRLYPFMD